MNASTVSVAIIGCGLSGLSAAKNLLRRGGGRFAVTIFEKSRGAGGRMSTRRVTDLNDSGSTSGSQSHMKNAQPLYSFDHGAQYFTVRDKDFETEFSEWLSKGIAKEWNGVISVVEKGKISPSGGDLKRYVGVEGMSSIAKYMAKEFNVIYNARVTKLQKNEVSPHRYTLHTDDGKTYGEFDWVVSTCPATQTIDLLKNHTPDIVKKASNAKMFPCWTLMLGFDKKLEEIPFDGAFLNGYGLSWIARNSSKPGRPQSESWVLQASPAWSEQHLEDSPEQVKKLLLEEFAEATKVDLSKHSIKFETAHRWRFAQVQAIPEPFLVDDTLRIAACGDWCGGPKVEGAFLSGYRLAEHILQVNSKL